jgi:hypothetical protein
MSLSPIDEAMRANHALSCVAEMLADSSAYTKLDPGKLSDLISILSNEFDRSLTAIAKEKRHAGVVARVGG